MALKSEWLKLMRMTRPLLDADVLLAVRLNGVALPVLDELQSVKADTSRVEASTGSLNVIVNESEFIFRSNEEMVGGVVSGT